MVKDRTTIGISKELAKKLRRYKNVHDLDNMDEVIKRIWSLRRTD